jgi:probable F420-dependent oxidoreductase
MSSSDAMRFGMVLPHYELGLGVQPIRDYARTVEQSGFQHVVSFDHILGADRSVRPDWRGRYDTSHQFHEPLVLFGFLAGITGLEMFTGILVLPQRQTVLVAKQVAEIDVLSEGRLRLGVGVGWNEIEFEALGVDFSSRTSRFEEQVKLLRLLWQDPSVTFTGDHHVVRAAGLNPLPTQRPVPLWFGGGFGGRHGAEFALHRGALERVGRLADGWYPNVVDRQLLEQGLKIVQAASIDAGRARNAVELEGMIGAPRDVSVEQLLPQIDYWHSLGASHVSFSPVGLDRSLTDHLKLVETIGEALRRWRAAG